MRVEERADRLEYQQRRPCCVVCVRSPRDDVHAWILTRRRPRLLFVEVRAAPPEELESSALIDFLSDGWDFDVAAFDYAPVGGGSYHWVVEDLEGRRSFVTADDLDQKPWLGDTRDSAFEGLRRAFDTAVALREGGLGFVVAPMLTTRGETASVCSAASEATSERNGTLVYRRPSR